MRLLMQSAAFRLPASVYPKVITFSTTVMTFFLNNF